MGTRLAEMMEEEADAGQTLGNCVSALEFSGDTALVSLSCLTQARVIVAVYAESGQMVTCGMQTAEAGTQELLVPMQAQPPEYFEAKAFLLDAQTGAPLCERFYTAMYTQPMRELMASSIYDYDRDRVLNLDGDPTNNFLVFDESVVQMDTTAGKNTASYINGVCTIANADETALGLVQGDVISVPDGNDGYIILRAASVSVSGDTVTITEDAEADLEDVFCAIKIDTDAAGDRAVDLDADEAPELMSDDAAQLMDDPGITVEGNIINLKPVIKGEEEGGILFSGKLTVKASVRFFHVPKYTEFEFKLKTDLSGTFGGYVKGKLEVPLTEDPLVFMPLKNVVEVTAKPVFKVEFEGKLVGENLGENSQKNGIKNQETLVL